MITKTLMAFAVIFAFSSPAFAAVTGITPHGVVFQQEPAEAPQPEQPDDENTVRPGGGG